VITFDLPFTTLSPEWEVLHGIDTMKSSGIEKLVRMYVKFLLTRKGSNLDDPSYGTNLIDIIGSVTDKEGMAVKAKVIEAVSATNKWFKEMQMTEKAEDGAMLKEGKIISVGYEPDGGKVSLRLVLINNTGRSAVFGLIL
jgi:hypothetical protein